MLMITSTSVCKHNFCQKWQKEDNTENFIPQKLVKYQFCGFYKTNSMNTYDLMLIDNVV